MLMVQRELGTPTFSAYLNSHTLLSQNVFAASYNHHR